MPQRENWREVLGPLDEGKLALHRRLVEADLRMGTLRLGELRRRHGVSQALVAYALDVSQPNVSRIEQAGDLRLSTLGRYLAALGARLEISAVFEDETVPLLAEPHSPGTTSQKEA